MTEFDSFEQTEVQEWRDGFDVPPGVLETVAHWVGFNQLMVVLSMLWPTFLIVQGCVLLPWEYNQQSFEGWWDELSGDRRKIESSLNHLHLWDVFDPDEISAEGLSYLGEVLAKTWSAALADRFPDRDFETHFTQQEDEYGPTVYIRSL